MQIRLCVQQRCCLNVSFHLQWQNKRDPYVQKDRERSDIAAQKNWTHIHTLCCVFVESNGKMSDASAVFYLGNRMKRLLHCTTNHPYLCALRPIATHTTIECKTTSIECHAFMLIPMWCSVWAKCFRICACLIYTCFTLLTVKLKTCNRLGLHHINQHEFLFTFSSLFYWQVGTKSNKSHKRKLANLFERTWLSQRPLFSRIFPFIEIRGVWKKQNNWLTAANVLIEWNAIDATLNEINHSFSKWRAIFLRIVCNELC